MKQISIRTSFKFFLLNFSQILYASGSQTGRRETLSGAPRKHAKLLHLSQISAHLVFGVESALCLEIL